MYRPIRSDSSAVSTNQRAVVARCIATFIAVPFRYLVGGPSAAVGCLYIRIILQIWNSFGRNSWSIFFVVGAKNLQQQQQLILWWEPCETDEERELSVSVFLLMSAAVAYSVQSRFSSSANNQDA